MALAIALPATADAAVRPATPKPPAATPHISTAVRTYTVRPGDNLETIAKRYGTTIKALAAANKIRNFNLVVIGTKLTIPAASAAALGKGPSKLKASPSRAALAPRFDYWARQYRVPPDLLKGLAWYESGWQNHVVSSTGAVGVGQLMPFTSEFVANQLLKNPNLDPKKVDDNIRMSARFLRWLLDRTGEDHAQTLASYYQGHRSVADRGWYIDTMRYVDAVIDLRWRFEA